MKKGLLLFTLIGGLIFSAMIRISFNLNDGFVFNDFMLKFLPLPLFDFAKADPNQLFLTSTIVGYVFYLIFCLIGLDRIKPKKPGIFFTFLSFVLLTLFASFYEITSIVKDYQGDFVGAHFRTGPVLFMIGLILFLQIRRK